jgi:hypothetical protein
MQQTASRLVSDFEYQIQQNRHYVSFGLADENEMEMMLSKGEAMMDLVINDIEFKSLQSLDG